MHRPPATRRAKFQSWAELRRNQRNLSQHYEKTAEEYEGAWFYRNDSPFQDFLLKEHLSCLDLQPRDKVIADVGAGSCNFSAKLAKASGLRVACVEPAVTLLQPDVPKEGCDKVLAGAEDYFKDKPKDVTKIIIKETVHHIALDKGDTASCFDEMAATLRQNGGGKLVIMTRPHDCSHFPFSQRVQEEWKKGQPEHTIYLNALKVSGFDEVDTKFSDFEITMKLEEWRTMVRNRFWSCFRNLTDAELEAGLVELDNKGQGENISMVDKILFIVATVRAQ